MSEGDTATRRFKDALTAARQVTAEKASMQWFLRYNQTTLSKHFSAKMVEQLEQLGGEHHLEMVPKEHECWIRVATCGAELSEMIQAICSFEVGAAGGAARALTDQLLLGPSASSVDVLKSKMWAELTRPSVEARKLIDAAELVARDPSEDNPTYDTLQNSVRQSDVVAIMRWASIFEGRVIEFGRLAAEVAALTSRTQAAAESVSKILRA